MSVKHDWVFGEQHLLPDAIVAFVDGELVPLAASRAAAHIARCAGCAAETAAQRQASGAVQSAEAPRVPADLLRALRSIPQNAQLPSGPDGLAITEDGTLVAVQRPDKAHRLLGSAPMLGSSAALGSSPGLLGDRRQAAGRKAVQGAGVVVSGLVLGALALVAAQLDDARPSAADSNPRQEVPAAAVPAATTPAVATAAILSFRPAPLH